MDSRERAPTEKGDIGSRKANVLVASAAGLLNMLTIDITFAACHPTPSQGIASIETSRPFQLLEVFYPLSRKRPVWRVCNFIVR